MQSLALIALALVTTQQPAPSPASSPDLEARFAALQKTLTETRGKLAQQAYDWSLYREAGSLADKVVASDPKHGIAEVSKRIKALSGEVVASSYKAALRRSGPRFRKALRKAISPLADQLVKLAAEARKEEKPGLRERILLAAYGADPDNKKAAQALRKLDYDVVFNYGVIPKADKTAARKQLRRLGGGFLGRSKLKDELEFWADAWGLQTRHYRFVTNADHGVVFQFAQACEDLHAAWHRFLRGSGATVRRLSKPLTIFFFDSKASYEIILRVRGLEPPDSDAVLGFYYQAVKTGFFYYDSRFYGDDLTLLFETFYHEGSHQLFDLAMKSASRGDMDKYPLHWVEEGFCVYLETLAATGEDEHDLVPGTIIDDDLSSALAAQQGGKLEPIDDFVHMTSEEFDEYGLGYPHAALLVHYLLHAKKGVYRKQAFQLLLAEKTQGGLRKENVFRMLRTDAKKLEAAVAEFAASIRKSRKERKYKTR